MDERALICAWLERYIAELEILAEAGPTGAAARAAGELDAARAILWSIESGDYLTDLGGNRSH
ncbi:hypothetical protein ACFOD9_13820 [Novosphingobium bradum]|uniref:Uncharacterized protein n=1 Tax=Novosphingobium bradum TaxID=1737444 RepID=A0ABV7IWH4_9SPHN